MTNANDLHQTIEAIATNVLESFLRNNRIIAMKQCTVAVGGAAGANCTLYFPGDSTNASGGYRNNTGATLTAGDVVFLIHAYGDITQGWIALKK